MRAGPRQTQPHQTRPASDPTRADPTRADPAAQTRLVGNVLECRKGCSVIWVLNRVDLAERFDHVLVMEQGKLVEQGAYDELLGRDGTMRRLLRTG